MVPLHADPNPGDEGEIQLAGGSDSALCITQNLEMGTVANYLWSRVRKPAFSA